MHHTMEDYERAAEDSRSRDRSKDEHWMSSGTSVLRVCVNEYPIAVALIRSFAEYVRAVRQRKAPQARNVFGITNPRWYVPIIATEYHRFLVKPVQDGHGMYTWVPVTDADLKPDDDARSDAAEQGTPPEVAAQTQNADGSMPSQHSAFDDETIRGTSQGDPVYERHDVTSRGGKKHRK